MIAIAGIVLAVRDTAERHDGARATVGRVEPIPGGTNVIASRVELWLDVRHPEDAVVAALVSSIHADAQAIAGSEGCEVTLTAESVTGTVHFDPALRKRLADVLPDAPILETGAGHDAGILGSVVPAAMLFVRNPTGISHAPAELVEDDDADRGAMALADVLGDLLRR